ncbi:hypothetical protein [Caulobacter sp. B11]|uniref:hypothetical protein n=1 Tax=Caulobacter sp. B11 TaxID=2048899 RepID=UPI001F1DEFF7|nr:hypothetical protein [Caulobacter sp. B11]
MLLVGDAPYFARIGFSPVPPPGDHALARPISAGFLVKALVPGGDEGLVGPIAIA